MPAAGFEPARPDEGAEDFKSPASAFRHAGQKLKNLKWCSSIREYRSSTTPGSSVIDRKEKTRLPA